MPKFELFAMNRKIIIAILKIVNKYWKKEREDWEKLGRPDNHIFNSINTVQNFLSFDERATEIVDSLSEKDLK